jgi:hypothetical protein
MERDLDGGQKKEAMDPIMMDKKQDREIIRKAGVAHNR